MLKNGRLFHSCIEDILLQKEVEIPPEVRCLHSSLQPVLEEIQAVQGVETRGVASESAVQGGSLTALLLIGKTEIDLVVVGEFRVYHGSCAATLKLHSFNRYETTYLGTDCT